MKGFSGELQTKLNQYKVVKERTDGKADIVSYWARRGVQAQARAEVTRLKGRVRILFQDRYTARAFGHSWKIRRQTIRETIAILREMQSYANMPLIG